MDRPKAVVCVDSRPPHPCCGGGASYSLRVMRRGSPAPRTSRRGVPRPVCSVRIISMTARAYRLSAVSLASTLADTRANMSRVPCVASAWCDSRADVLAVLGGARSAGVGGGSSWPSSSWISCRERRPGLGSRLARERRPVELRVRRPPCCIRASDGSTTLKHSLEDDGRIEELGLRPLAGAGRLVRSGGLCRAALVRVDDAATCGTWPERGKASARQASKPTVERRAV